MTSNFDHVGEFHQQFDLDNVTFNGAGDRQIDPEVLPFRLRFLHEELEEFEEGVDEMNHAKMFDALLDLVYVAMGTAQLLGYPWQVGWEAVQAANMAKVRAAQDGSDSKRGSSLDVVKPDGWQAPDMEEILRRVGFDI